jgi:hypothetical protein
MMGMGDNTVRHSRVVLLAGTQRLSLPINRAMTKGKETLNKVVGGVGKTKTKIF